MQLILPLIAAVLLVLLPILTVTFFENYSSEFRTRMTFGIIKLGATAYFLLGYLGRINHMEIASQSLILPVLYGLAGLFLVSKATKDRKQLVKN